MENTNDTSTKYLVANQGICLGHFTQDEINTMVSQKLLGSQSMVQIQGIWQPLDRLSTQNAPGSALPHTMPSPAAFQAYKSTSTLSSAMQPPTLTPLSPPPSMTRQTVPPSTRTELRPLTQLSQSSPQAQPAYTQPPQAYPQAQPAYPQAQPAYPQAQPAYTQTQPAYPQAQPAYTQAQPAYPQAQPAYTQAQPAYTQPPQAYPQAQQASLQSNLQKPLRPIFKAIKSFMHPHATKKPLDTPQAVSVSPTKFNPPAPIASPPSAPLKQSLPRVDAHIEQLNEQNQESDFGYDSIDEATVVTCPHCWFQFGLSKINYVSQHLDLMGDPILGSDAPRRFLPTRFNEQGYAFDDRGMVCTEMACPRCHLSIPEAIIDMPSQMFSIVGAPASGKSYFLAAMVWQLRTVLSRYFDYSFTDTDSTFNAVLNNYETLLFLNPNHDQYVALPKTDLQGSDFSHQVLFKGLRIDLPLPFVFTLSPTPANPHYSQEGTGNHNLIFYDNAGEHFEPGRDQATNLASHHLMKSQGIIFLYDPLKDSRMLSLCNADDPQVSQLRQSRNQLVLLNEMIARIKRYKGYKSTDRCDAPLVVVLPKYDAWMNNFPLDLQETEYLNYDPSEMNYALDLGVIWNVSYIMRTELMRISPEVVATCEAFFSTVYFIPVSSLGRMPEYDAEKDMIAIKPEGLQPLWPEVPLLIQLWISGLIPGRQSEVDESLPVETYKFYGDSIVYTLPNSTIRESVPKHYAGKTVYDTRINHFISFPNLESGTAGTSETPPEGPQQSSADDAFWEA